MEKSNMALNGLWIVFVICSITSLTSAASSTDNLEQINGQLVRVNDNCTLGDDTTCADGHCCVKENLVYMPDYTGPQPDYQISCRPYRKQGEFCYTVARDEMCPCASPLKCQSQDSFAFGNCA